MTSEMLVSFAGVLLSLSFSYLPGLKDFYDTKDSQTKQLIMLALMVVVAAGSVVLSCTGEFAYFECSGTGGWDALQVLFTAVVANQVAYQSTKHIGKSD